MLTSQLSQCVLSFSAPAHSPEGVRVEAMDAHTLNVSWSPPSMQQNGVIRNYSVNLTEAVTGLGRQYSANITSILIRELVAYHTYFIQVAAVTTASGPFSDSVYAATPEAGKKLLLNNCAITSLKIRNNRHTKYNKK